MIIKMMVDRNTYKLNLVSDVSSKAMIIRCEPFDTSTLTTLDLVGIVETIVDIITFEAGIDAEAVSAVDAQATRRIALTVRFDNFEVSVSRRNDQV